MSVKASPSILAGFRLVLFFVGTWFVCTALPVYRPSQEGVLEFVYNLLVVQVVYAFPQIAPMLIVLALPEAILRSVFYTTWNRRLAEHVRSLRSRGMPRQADEMASRHVTARGWAVIVTVALGLFASIDVLANFQEIRGWLTHADSRAAQLVVPDRIEHGNGHTFSVIRFTPAVAFLASSAILLVAVWIERLLALSSFLWQAPEGEEKKKLVARMPEDRPVPKLETLPHVLDGNVANLMSSRS